MGGAPCDAERDDDESGKPRTAAAAHRRRSSAPRVLAARSILDHTQRLLHILFRRLGPFCFSVPLESSPRRHARAASPHTHRSVWPRTPAPAFPRAAITLAADRVNS